MGILPDQPGGTSLDFDLLGDLFGVTADGSIPGLALLTQPNVEATLKGDVQSSPGWLGANDAAYGGLLPGVALIPNLLMNIATTIIGLPFGTWPGEGPLGFIGEIPNIFADMGNFFGNITGIFGGGVDFNDLAFNPLEAVFNFVDTMIVPTDLLASLIGGFIPGTQIPGLDASKIITGEFPMEMITGLVGILDDVPVLGDLLGWFGLDPGGDESDLQNLLGGFLGENSPLNAFNLFNVGNLLGVIPVSQLGQESPNLLDNSDFREVISLQGGGIWTWDSVEGKTVPGCASVDAASVARLLRSNAIKVTEGDELDLGVSVKWSGLTYTGTQPIKLQLMRLLYDPVSRTFSEQGAVEGAAVETPPATQAAWVDLSNSYSVPAATTHVSLQLCVDANAITGTVKFDDGFVKKVGLANPGWFSGLLGGGNLAEDILNIPAKIFEGITGGVFGGDTLNILNEIADALTNIPFTNVGGVGGPENIGGSVTEFLNKLVSGFVGVLGSGASFADVFNVGQEVSANANMGKMGWDILGVRNNKSLNTGFHDSSLSNIMLDSIAVGVGVTALPTFALTQSTAITGYQRISEAADFRLVAWQGFGITDITHCFVNIYKMDTSTGVNALVHASANVVGQLTAGTEAVPAVYRIPEADAIHVEPNEVYGIEIAVRGSGTYNIAGAQSGLKDQPVYPRRYSSVRNSGTSAAPASFTPTYGTNVPFIEFGVDISGVEVPHSAVYMQVDTLTGTVPIPAWCNYVDRIALGGGGGGHNGGTWGISGGGGDAGQWASDMLTRGIDFDADDSLSHSLGLGGVGGGGGAGNGVTGGSTTSTCNGDTLTGLGGAGSTELGGGGSNREGESPGTFVWPGLGPPWTLVGGAEQFSYSADGNFPGGGGCGGDWVAFGIGGDGAIGSLWYRFRQF